MSKGLSFLVVFTVTVISWILLGYILQFFLSTISISVFLFIGLAAGLFLASVFHFVREDPAPQAAASLDQKSESKPGTNSSDIRLNSNPTSQTPEN